MSVLKKIRRYFIRHFVTKNELDEVQSEFNMVLDKAIGNITMRPGAVINTYSNSVPFYGTSVMKQLEAEGDEERARAEVLNHKVWKMKAEYFVKRYPKWNIKPDPEAPLRKIYLEREDGKYQIRNQFPSNEFELKPQSMIGEWETWRQVTKHGHTEHLGMTYPRFPMHVFDQWALNVEDCPYGE